MLRAIKDTSKTCPRSTSPNFRAIFRLHAGISRRKFPKGTPVGGHHELPLSFRFDNLRISGRATCFRRRGALPGQMSPHGILTTMRGTVQTTIDSAGRLVLPKAIREEAGILPGMTLRITVQEGKVEIEPLPGEVKIVQRGPLWIAVPAEAGPALSEETVDQVLRKVRERGE